MFSVALKKHHFCLVGKTIFLVMCFGLKICCIVNTFSIFLFYFCSTCFLTNIISTFSCGKFPRWYFSRGRPDLWWFNNVSATLINCTNYKWLLNWRIASAFIYTRCFSYGRPWNIKVNNLHQIDSLLNLAQSTPQIVYYIYVDC